VRVEDPYTFQQSETHIPVSESARHFRRCPISGVWWSGGSILALSLSLCFAATASETRAFSADLALAIDNTLEVNHQVVVRPIGEDTALFTVTREFVPKVPTQPIELVSEPVSIPNGAVVTSFEVQTDGTWRDGHLRHYAAAPAEKGAKNRPFASLAWQTTASAAGIEVPAYVAKMPLRVRYQIWARAQLTDRGLRWQYCEHSDGELAKAGTQFSLDSLSPILQVHRDTNPDSDHCVLIERPLPVPSRLTARYGRYYLGSVWWWRIESAWPLSLPASPDTQAKPVVFVLDTSRSQLQKQGLLAQLQIVKALLTPLRRSEIELILVNRFAMRVFGHFSPAADVDPKVIDALSNTPLGNGSFLDRGMALAVQALSTKATPGRIVVMGDGELRKAFNVAAAIGELRRAPKGTVVNLLEQHSGDANQVEAFDPNSLEESPFEESDVKRLAAVTGGSLHAATVGAQSAANQLALADLLATSLLGAFVKPESWERITLRDATRPGLRDWPSRIPMTGAELDAAPSGNYYPSYLDRLTSTDRDSSVASNSAVLAGARQVWSGFSRTAPPTRLALVGQAAGRTVQIRLKPDPLLEAQLPRLANSEWDIVQCLSVPHHSRYALAAGFLAPDLEFWVPGAKEPDEEEGNSSGGFDTSCNADGMGGWGSGAAPLHGPFPEVAELLKPCGLVISALGKSRVTVETRSSEILDIATSGLDRAKKSCVEEALWGLDLPSDFNHGASATYVLPLAALK
jgi:hypothetical protein